MYRCYSVSMLPGTERDNVDRGGRIFLPPSALDQLTRLNIVYPMLFKLTNPQKERVTHCGVLEFVADEGKCYMPYWMMRNLLLDEGAFVKIESVSLPVATFSKFQPQSVDFLDITNPKAVLENELRSFACLTTGDVIAISYNDRIYELCVLETKPEPAVSIIECDMNVDFAPPVGYVEPSAEPKKEETAKPAASTSQSRGFRIDGKSTAPEDVHTSATATKGGERGQPDYDYKIGYIKFWRDN